MPKLDVLLLVAMATLSAASANEVLPDRFPDLSSEAWVEEAEVAPDGSVFLLGDFTSVDGIPRPGLAKLQPNGRLDTDFAPLEVEDDFNVVPLNTPLPSFGFGVRLPGLFALSNGGLIRSNSFRFEIRHPNGSLDEQALAGLRDETISLLPQFEAEGRIWLVARNDFGSSRIIVIDSLNLESRTEFQFPADFPEAPFGLSPAAEGKIWVLGRAPTPSISTFPVGSNIRQVIYRLNQDGSLDTTFNPEELDPKRNYRFEESSDPGFILSSNWPERFFYWPRPSAGQRTFEFRNSEGLVLETASISTSLGLKQDYLIRDRQIISFPAGNTNFLGSSGSLPSTGIALDPAIRPLASTALDLLPNSQILLGGVRQLRDDGSLEPSWHVARLAGPTRIGGLLPLANHDVIALGNFDFASGLKRYGGIRLRPDGSLDPSFACPLDLRRAFRLEEKSNGHFLLLMDQEYPDGKGGKSRFLELDPTGAVVRALDISGITGNFHDSLGGPRESLDFLLQPDDSIIFSVIQFAEVTARSLFRIPADDFENPVLIQFGFNSFSPISGLPDGRLIIGNDLFTAEGMPSSNGVSLPPGTFLRSTLQNGRCILEKSNNDPTEYFLWHPDQGPVSGFVNTTLEKMGIGSPAFQTAAREKYFVSNKSGIIGGGVIGPRASPYGSLYADQILRLHADGTLDPTFEVTPGPLTTISTFLPRNQDNPTLWVAGNFTEINGVPRQGLAAISDNQASGFQEWMRACAGIAPGLPTAFGEQGDEDGDGFSNFFEYAAGSHPVQRLGLPQGLTQTGPLTWQVSCNPEAPELIRRLEVSNNLVDWRPAQASDLRIESGLRCLSWTLQGQPPRLYTRLKVTQ